MATPSAITIGNGSFTGKWVIQGVGWVLRKAASLAVVTLHCSISAPSASHAGADSQPSPQSSHLSVLQVPTAGLGPISESRILDWEERTPLRDFLFGTRLSRNHLIAGKRGVGGRILPDLVPETAIHNELIGQMLRGETPPDGCDGSGFLVEGDDDEAEDAGLWIHSFDYREDGAWTVEQVWGFEMIGGERFHTRRFVVASKGGKIEMGRIVFSYAGPLEG
ncbi:hypothetical protein N7466_009053 [Penicillium verhagenii]|uniref:uncharacterized protein n=1 Tax=Penicillium verhagenii TaxID=1562060 RepID=UPI002545ACF5|nr:uncharacterized protein N7466_009053 [Penicillium verhagenii]KAJ5924866.1 hypothetical protein N7466_009053 [Penicillium verhagenii]